MRLGSRLRAGLGLALLITLLGAGPMAAGRQSVDPSTLNPPPPDFFNAECTQAGFGTLCTLAFTDPDIVQEPSGVVCGTVELTYSQTRSVAGRRSHDRDGNLTERHFREFWGGSFSNPETGLRAPFTGQDTVIHKLVVPGDLSTGVIRTTGLGARVMSPDGRTILVDAGRIVRSAANEEVIGLSGQHPFEDYFALGDAAALQPLCDALD